jgi:hypothetical protein
MIIHVVKNIIEGEMLDCKENYQREIDLLAEERFGKENYQRIKIEGILHDRDLRNIKIRVMFNKLRNQKMNVEDACKLISSCPFYSPSGQRYFISPGRIRNIAYPKKEKEDGQ